MPYVQLAEAIGEGDEPLDPICPSCGVQQTGVPRRYCVPEFGFVARRDTKRPGMSPPRRSWNGATYVLSLGLEVEEATWPLANGGTATTRAVSRGQLIAVSEGPSLAGYLICDWCGWGTPSGARYLRSIRTCFGTRIAPATFNPAHLPTTTRRTSSPSRLTRWPYPSRQRPVEINPLRSARRGVGTAADKPGRHRRDACTRSRRPDLASDLRCGSRRGRQRHPHRPFVRRGAGGSTNPGHQM